MPVACIMSLSTWRSWGRPARLRGRSGVVMGRRNAVAVDSPRACLELELACAASGPTLQRLPAGWRRPRSPDADPAVVTYNDLLAIGLMRGLTVRVRVPDDVNVVASTTSSAPISARRLDHCGGAAANSGLQACSCFEPCSRALSRESVVPLSCRCSSSCATQRAQRGRKGSSPARGTPRCPVGRPRLWVDLGRVQVIQAHGTHPLSGIAVARVTVTRQFSSPVDSLYVPAPRTWVECASTPHRTIGSSPIA